MKLKIEAKQLAAALAQSTPGPISRDVLIYGSALLIAEDGSLSIQRASGSANSAVRVQADVEKEGTCVTGTAKLEAYVKRLNGVVSLSAAKRLTVAGENSERAQLPTSEVGLFPTWIKWPGDAPVVKVPVSNLVKACKPAMCVTRGTNGYPAIQGAQAEINGGLLRLVAADRHRLVLHDDGLGDGEPEYTAVWTDTLLKRLAVLSPEGELEVARSERLLFFRKDGWEFTARVEGDNYPDWRRVVPPDPPNSVVFPAVHFLTGLGRVCSMIDRKNDGRDVEVSLKKKDGLALSWVRTDREAFDRVEQAEIQGEDIVLRFNGDYLRDALTPFKSGKAVLRWTDEKSAAIVEGVEESNPRTTIMPVRAS